MPDLTGLMAVVLIFGLPVLAVIVGHRQKMMEMRLKLRASTDETVLRELQDLRREVAELRDTTTKYDMSFDSALERLEMRVRNLEQSGASSDQPSQLGGR